MASTTTIIATAAAVASVTKQVSQVPEWFSYMVDIGIALVFLFVLFFTKAEPQQETSQEEMPNELEKVICTDPVEGEEEGAKSNNASKR